MSNQNLRLQVILGAVDKLTRPFKSAQESNKRLAETLKQSRQQLRDLNQQAGRIDGFRKTKKTLIDTQQAYREATQRAAALAREMKSVENPTKAQAQQFERAKKAAAQFKEKTQALNQSLQRQRDALSASGISTKNLGEAQRRLNGDISRTNSTLTKQQQRLEQLQQREKRLSAAKSRYHNVKNVQGSMLASAAGMGATGGGLLMGVKPMLNEASIYHKEMAEFRALGVGDNILKDANKFSSSIKIVGNATSDNLKILKEAHSVLRHYDEAKMVTPELLKLQYATRFLSMHGISEEKATEMRDQSQEVLKIAELRNMINNTDEFKKSVNLSAQAMAASGGLVLPSDYMAMLKTGNVAAKQMSDEAFYFSMSHIIQQIGGDRTGTSLASAYQNLMMGRTTQGAAEELNELGLLKKGAVKYGKTGHITKVKPGALVNAEKFQSDPFRYLMEDIVPRIRKKRPQLDERGMETAIAKLFSNRKGADLFVTMYREHANIEKQIKAGHEAYKVDQLIAEGQTTAQGQELEMEARKRDLYKQIGDHLLPLYIKGLAKLSEMLGKIKTFFQEHPTVAKYLSIAAAGLGIILAIFGALTLVLATLLGPLAMIRLGLTVLGIKGAGSVLGLSGALTKLGGVLRFLKVLALTHPLLLILTAIAIAAYLIWKNWDKLGPWFKQLWDDIAAYVSTAWQNIKQKILNKWEEIKQDTLNKWNGIKKNISDKWNEIVEDTKKLPEKFKQFGTEIIDKLINGIKEKWKALKQSIANLGSEIKDAVTPDFMKTQSQQPEVQQALDAYNDATRPHANPFAAFSGAHDRGGYIPTGKFGLVGERGPELINGPARVTSRRQTAALATMAAAALSLGTASASTQQAPLHPYSLPASQYQPANVAVISQQHSDSRPAYTINIYPTPAQSSQDIARMVAQEIDRREQQRRARARSTFYDSEEF
ncbi:phage tail tape measure protein [Xenorhabdus sp. IM139775]|uniref:phage tail tape measure protein n=1 Tax=Xenorhabdus sp. IM139775 TaxID=3025876 RepID=UPI002358C24A|nr:phage tail tape measure protein [Xenorhabdus sp. IM139775]MDC9594186.1 phage tail tape measure protein [Xenorhabdus sp. IM139775]